VREWLDDLRELAGLGAEPGVTNIMGIGIFNEPWDYTWEEWRSLIDQAYEAINEVNPNIFLTADCKWLRLFSTSLKFHCKWIRLCTALLKKPVDTLSKIL
jgi:hypothetical protein